MDDRPSIWIIESLSRKSLHHAVVRFLVTSIATLFLLAMVTSAAFAQGETAQINGKVIDPEDRVVPGATVTVKSVTTGSERTTTTDDQGDFTVSSLQPGLYDVSVKAGQFTESTQRAQVSVGATISLDTKLSTQADPARGSSSETRQANA